MIDQSKHNIEKRLYPSSWIMNDPLAQKQLQSEPTTWKNNNKAPLFLTNLQHQNTNYFPVQPSPLQPRNQPSKKANNKPLFSFPKENAYLWSMDEMDYCKQGGCSQTLVPVVEMGWKKEPPSPPSQPQKSNYRLSSPTEGTCILPQGRKIRTRAKKEGVFVGLSVMAANHPFSWPMNHVQTRTSIVISQILSPPPCFFPSSNEHLSKWSFFYSFSSRKQDRSGGRKPLLPFFMRCFPFLSVLPSLSFFSFSFPFLPFHLSGAWGEENKLCSRHTGRK